MLEPPASDTLGRESSKLNSKSLLLGYYFFLTKYLKIELIRIHLFFTVLPFSAAVSICYLSLKMNNRYSIPGRSSSRIWLVPNPSGEEGEVYWVFTPLCS